MRFSYKAYPLSKPNPAFPDLQIRWMPVIPVRLVDKRTQRKTKALQAVVDSGSDMCFFHADVLAPFRITLEDGIPDEIGGVGQQTRIPVFYHDIGMLIGLVTQTRKTGPRAA